MNCDTAPSQPRTALGLVAQGATRQTTLEDFYAWDSRMAGTSRVKHVSDRLCPKNTTIYD